MTDNFLNLLKDQVTGSLAKQASGFLGESESNVTTALNGAFPTLLGSLIDKGSDEKGANDIMNMIGSLDMNMLGDISKLFGGGASNINGLLNSGGGIIESLLGNKMSGVVDIISNMSGLKSGSTSSLLKMAAPFLMGLIGKKIKGKGITGLMDLLMGQKSHVKDAMPAGIGGLLGLSSLGDFGKDLTKSIENAGKQAMASTNDLGKAATAKVNETASTGMGWIKWALPLIIIGGLGWWLISSNVLGGAKNTMGDAVNTVKNTAGEVANATEEAASNATNMAKEAASSMTQFAKTTFTTVDETAMSALDKIKFEANSVGMQMMDFIQSGFEGDPTFKFNKLNFESGSAKIMEESMSEVDHLAAILKAYPKVNVVIEGHTDNTGDESNNLELSKARAMSVKARLMAQDIEASRISTDGFGASKPIASNETAEGQAQNRRIEVRLAQ